MYVASIRTRMNTFATSILKGDLITVQRLSKDMFPSEPVRKT